MYSNVFQCILAKNFNTFKNISLYFKVSDCIPQYFSKLSDFDAVFLVAVFGYNKQHRDASIEADLNKLYDTRPTSGSLVNDDAAYHAKTQKQAATQMDLSQSQASENASPYFDLNYSGNVTAVLGKTALLNCRVKNIGNKTVMGIYFSTIDSSVSFIFAAFT